MSSATKRIVLSAVIGCLLTTIVYFVCQIPTQGPTLLALIWILPIQILSSLITKDRNLGEYAFFCLQILILSGMSYLVLEMFRLGAGKGGRK